MRLRTAFLAAAIGVASGVAGALWPPCQPAPTAEVEAPLPGPLGGAPAVTELRSSAVSGWTQAPVEVRVLRRKTPVAGADVALWRQTVGEQASDWSSLVGAVTDSNGLISMVVPPGSYVARARNDGDQATIFIAVPASRTTERFDIELAHLRTVSGQVIDKQTRQGVAGARLQVAPYVLGLSPPSEAHTPSVADGLGRFSLEAGPEVLEVQASADRYVPGREVVLDGGASSITFELERAAQIEGEVTTRTGSPVALAVVSSAPGIRSTSTDEVGRFALETPPGQVTIAAISPTGRQGLSRIEALGGQVTKVRLIIEEGAALEGRVVNSVTDGAVAGARVRLASEPDGFALAHTVSGPTGSFAFAAIPAGRFTIRAQVGEGSIGERVGIEVEGSKPPAEVIEVRLHPAATLVGLVTDENHRPIEGAEVAVDNKGVRGERVSRTARSDEYGRFEIGDLPPSEVRVEARLGEVQTLPILEYLAPGGQSQVTLVIRAPGRLIGTVRGDGGPYTVMVTSGVGGAFFEQWEANPDFSRTLPSGSYYIMAAPKHSTRFFRRSDPVEVPAGAEARVEVVANERRLEQGDRRSLHQYFEKGPEMGLSFNNEAGSVAVSWLATESPGFVAGLRVGDVIISIDGQGVKDSLDAFGKAKGSSGNPVVYLVRRQGTDLRVTVNPRSDGLSGED